MNRRWLSIGIGIGIGIASAVIGAGGLRRADQQAGAASAPTNSTPSEEGLRTLGRSAISSAPAPLKAMTWANLESAQYSEFIANLRRFGCPEDTLRDIVLSDLVANLSDRTTNSQAWSEMLGAFPDRLVADRVVEAARRLLGRTDIARLEPRPPTSPDGAAGKQAEVNRIESEAAARAAEVWRRLGTNAPSESDLELLRALSRDREMALGTVLTGDEKETYDARASGALIDTLDQYAELNLTEDEALRLRKLESPASDGKGPGPDEMETGIRALLGDARYLDYQRLQDPHYVQLQSFAQDQQLDLRKVREVFDRAAGASAEGDWKGRLGSELATHFGPATGELWANHFRRPGVAEPSDEVYRSVR